MQQPQPRQQPGFIDMQMLQQHIMLKQLQELRRHQQLQELGDGRQQNYLNQLSGMNKQAAGGQFLPPINGTPIHDSSQTFMVDNMNLVERGAPPSIQGFSNGFCSQAQSQDLCSVSPVPQQLEVSLYGTPIASGRNNLNQYSHLQGLSHDSANVLTKGSDNQAEKPTMQPSDFSNSFLSENCSVSSDQLCMPDGAFLSKQFFDAKNLLGQVPIQGFSGGILPENFQQMNALQRNASTKDGKQEQAGYPEQFPGKTTQIDPSQGLTTLDPLEQKILFNMDDNSWNASLGSNTDIGTGSFGNALECADYLSSFPSIQSGSWSALMQSAVAEASSSDTGLQEEWSGLSFQNTELSNDHQPSNFLESRKQQTGWVDNNMQIASLHCKPQLLFDDSNMSSGFPGFQQSGIQFSAIQREAMRSDSSHESVQQSPKIAAKWLDCNAQQNQPIEGSQPIHIIQPLENAWPGQNFEHSEGNARQQSISSYKNSHQRGDKLIGSKMESSSPSGNVTLNVCNNEKQQSCYQREKSNDSYHSSASQHTITEDDVRENMWLHESDSQPVARGNRKSSDQVLCRQVSQGSSNHEQGYFAQFKFVGDVSRSAVELEKGCLPDIQRNSKASEEVPPRGIVGANVSASSDSSVGYGPNRTSQTSQNMLELLHKVDHGREQRTVTHLSTTDSCPLLEVPEAKTPEAFMAKSYDQSFISPRFGLRLAPPSQRLPNSSSFFSLQSSPQSGNSTATSPTGPFNLRNQLQSPQATLPDMARRLPQFNCATSPTSSLSEQVGSSTRPPSVWRNLPTQPHLSVTELHELPSDLLLSADSTNTNLQTPSWATHGQNSYKGTESRDLGACSMNSQGFEYGEEHPEKERSQQQISSEMVDQASQMGGLFHGQESVAKHLSEPNAVGSGSLMARPYQNFNSAWHGDKQASAVSARDLEAFGRSLKPSNLHPSYSLLHQVHSLTNMETDPSRRVSDKNHTAGSDLNVQQVTAVAGHQMMYGHNSASRLNSFPTRDVKMLSFSSEAGDDQSVKALSLPLQDTPHEMATHDQSYLSDLAFNRTEHSQINVQMAPSWFKHFGTLKNGQMLPMYDARTANNSVQQFPLGRPFENLHMNTSVVQVNVPGPSQVSSVWPTTATTLAVGTLSPPFVLSKDASDHNFCVTTSKKRKIAASELLPWHKEVTQSSKRLPTISSAELEWVQAANRLVEKVENEAEMIEDLQLLLRPKKRLVLTTQLMQQMFRPAPAAILSADATSNCDSVAYFAAKLALGDACNLIYCSGNDSCLLSNDNDVMSEKPKTSERIDEQYFSKIVEDFSSRAMKLESDLFRLNKTASIVDIRVEYQEIEKFSVINRFARFHCRGQSDAAETSSSGGTTPTALKSCPQRYVTAFPMPRTVPEGAPCLSL
ncbi:hypothetical protein CsSME_00004138 [Camellia sinensis var. sinensis]